MESFLASFPQNQTLNSIDQWSSILGILVSGIVVLTALAYIIRQDARLTSLVADFRQFVSESREASQKISKEQDQVSKENLRNSFILDMMRGRLDALEHRLPPHHFTPAIHMDPKEKRQ